MYGYKTKHTILATCMSVEISNAANKTDKLLLFERLYDFLSKQMSADTFGKNLVYLHIEHYLIIDKSKSPEIFILLTDKGRSAFLNKYFIQKNNEIFSKRIVDYILSICNLGVLIIAIITISKNNDERIKSIENRLLRIDEVILPKRIPIQTNLDTQINKNLPVKRTLQRVLKDSVTPTK